MLFFDLDGTLVDSAGVWLQIDLDFCTRRGLVHTRQYHDFVAHASARTAAQFTKEYYHLSESEEEIMFEWANQALDEYTHNIPLKPYVRTYLEHCRNIKRQHMAILTSNTPQLCHAVLQRTGLEHYFDEFLYVQDFQMEKSDPSLFLAAAERCAHTPEECTLYDDSPVACNGAKRAGLTVIGVYDPFFKEDAPAMRNLCDRYITDFSELLSER